MATHHLCIVRAIIHIDHDTNRVRDQLNASSVHRSCIIRTSSISCLASGHSQSSEKTKRQDVQHKEFQSIHTPRLIHAHPPPLTHPHASRTRRVQSDYRSLNNVNIDN